MATTYEAIATTTVGAGGAANITFSSIPGTYTDLIVKWSSRCATGGPADVLLRLNSDTGSNYPYRQLQGNGSTVGSGSGTSTGLATGASTGTGDTASTFSNNEVYIPNYTSANYKSASSDSVTENNATTAYATLRAPIWNNTSAITSIAILNADASNLAQHSTATLYGIKNS